MKTPEEIDNLFVEFEATMIRKFPSEEYGEDSDCDVLMHIAEQLRNAAKLTERAFVAGRSNTSWEQFKKDNKMDL